jgi:hypothetical protein
MPAIADRKRSYEIQITRARGEGFAVRRIGPYPTPRVAALRAARVRFRPDQIVEVIKTAENEVALPWS